MVIILRGIQGSGKSTLAAEFRCGQIGLIADYWPALTDLGMDVRDGLGPSQLGQIFSSDTYFMNDGEYKFDPAHLSAAHADCLLRFIKAAEHPGLLIVDNTNATIAEVGPYAAIAGAFQHQFFVVTLLVNPREGLKRQIHGAPATNVVKTHFQLEKSILEWPPWWPQTVVPC